MSFAAAIASGLNAAEAAWGASWNPEGTGMVFTGTFDRLDDRSTPQDGGYRPEWNASLVASIAQLQAVGLVFVGGGAIEGVEAGTGAFTLAGGVIDQFLNVGQKLISGGVTYRIVGRSTDGFTVDFQLASPNR